MSDCLFCKIISGEIPSSKVYEDEYVYAFNDISPEAPVHVLIVPKEHIESANDIDENNADIVAKKLYEEGGCRHFFVAHGIEGERIRNLAQNELLMLRPERAETQTIYIQAPEKTTETTLQQNEEPRMEALDILLGLLNVFHIGE